VIRRIQIQPNCTILEIEAGLTLLEAVLEVFIGAIQISKKVGNLVSFQVLGNVLHLLQMSPYRIDFRLAVARNSIQNLSCRLVNGE
jgi:hypothetical protein